MPWFDDNAPERVARLGPRMGVSNPAPQTIPYDTTGQGIDEQYRPPTGGINPDGMYSSTTPPATSSPATWDEASFTAQFGRPGTPNDLIALEQKLNAQGIKVLRNASGVAGKIQLPNGQIVDVINSAGLGGRGFQWDTGPGGGVNAYGAGQPYAGTFTGGGQYPLASVMGSGLMQPWTTPFVAPTDVTQQNDPGWQFRMKEGLGALQRSAAAKGTLLTGGAMKDLNAWAQDYASNEYDKVYNRALGEYQQAYGIFNNNQNNQFSRLYGMSGQGLNAAQSQAGNNSSYGNTAAGIMTDIGDVNAAGQVGARNATNSGINNAVDTATKLAYWYATRPGSSAPPGGSTTGVTVGGGPGGTPYTPPADFTLPKATFPQHPSDWEGK